MAYTVYSVDRATQLRMLLYAALVVAGLLALAAVWGLATGFPLFAVAMALPAVTVAGSALASLRHLRRRSLAAKVMCVMTGVLLVLVGLILAQLVVGILPSIVGVLLILLALLKDVGAR
jgi:hypothetical protein